MIYIEPFNLSKRSFTTNAVNELEYNGKTYQAVKDISSENEWKDSVDFIQKI